MNWADLWHLRFGADVWGTVAAWVSAFITGGGFLIAALVYWRDSNLSRSSQAKLILPRIVSEPLGEDVRIVVENYSSSSIFHPQAELRRVYLGEAIRTDSAEEVLMSPDPAKAKVREIVNRTTGEFAKVPTLKKYEADSERLASSGACEFHVSRTRFQLVFVTFVDARGRGWEIGDLAGPRPTLKKVKKPSGERKWLNRNIIRVRHPRRASREFRMRMKIGWRAFWLQALLSLAEELGKDEEFMERLRESVRNSLRSRLNREEGSGAGDSGVDTQAPEPPKQGDHS
ncbi:hypothetical protein [Mycolicibacterium sp. XJ775]